MEGKTAPDCRQYCLNCGVCNDNNISPVLFDSKHPLDVKRRVLANQSYEQGKKYRICFTKLEKSKYLSHLELIKVFIRAFRRAEIDLMYSSGYHPMPKVSFAMALPVGTESLGEIVDIQAKNIRDTSLTIKKLNEKLPSGIRILSMEEMAIKEPPARIKESYFYLQANGYFNKEAADRFLMLKSCLAVKKRGNGDKIVDIRSQVKALHMLSNGALELTVRHGEGPELKPTEIIKNVFALNDTQSKGISVLKTKSLII